MIDIRRALQPYLQSLHPRTYYGSAPAGAVMPYLVYDLPSVRSEGEGQLFLTLDVDGWDRKPDSTELEELMAKVRDNLDRHVFIGQEYTFRLRLGSQLSLSEDDPAVRRRKLTFYGRTFRRSE